MSSMDDISFNGRIRGEREPLLSVTSDSHVIFNGSNSRNININSRRSSSCGVGGDTSDDVFDSDLSSPVLPKLRRYVNRRHLSAHKKTPAFESLDYDIMENDIFVEEESRRSTKEVAKVRALRWGIIFVIGALTAIVAFFIDIGVTSLSAVKFSAIQTNINHCVKHNCLGYSLLLWLGIDVGCVLLAAMLVCYGEPVAAGSGIPEIKCYLNGVKVPHVVRFKTLCCKVIGVLASVVGGLAVGKEGPMIHSGAVVAAGVSQGKSSALGFDLGFFKQFRTDTEKRDFVSGGAAAGVSAAFGAPVGGVLFSLEEGASFWNQSLTWRIFFCSFTGTFVLNIFLSGVKTGQWGNMSNPGLLNFGQFNVDSMNYFLFEFPIFMLIGVLGGLAGALFNSINHRITIFRMNYVNTRPRKVLEAVIVAMVTAILAFSFIYYLDDCIPIGDYDGENPLEVFCSDHNYNEMGTLLFNTPEESIKNLFHLPRDVYHVHTLAIFFVLYFVLAVWTYGIAVPSGLFVPTLLTGAAGGRLVGVLLNSLFPHADWVMPGKYALFGAAAMLAGVVRMTISLTVILIEATGDVTYGLPIITVVVIAKLVGDFFNHGLYDIHIDLRKVPLLEWHARRPMQTYFASHVMSQRVKFVHEVERVGTIYQLLKRSSHNAYPVVAIGERFNERRGHGRFCGLVLRYQMLTLLQHKRFCERDGRPEPGYSTERLSVADFRALYPRLPDFESLHLSAEEMDMYVDFSPYKNANPYTLHDDAPLSRVFRLFRTMGLRHLVIVGRHNEVLGIITRKDLHNLHFVSADTTEFSLDPERNGSICNNSDNSSRKTTVHRLLCAGPTESNNSIESENEYVDPSESLLSTSRGTVDTSKLTGSSFR